MKKLLTISLSAALLLGLSAPLATQAQAATDNARHVATFYAYDDEDDSQFVVPIRVKLGEPFEVKMVDDNGDPTDQFAIMMPDDPNDYTYDGHFVTPNKKGEITINAFSLKGPSTFKVYVHDRDFSTALPIVVGNNPASLDELRDIQYFKFVAPEDGKYTLSSNSKNDVEATLFDGDLNELGVETGTTPEGFSFVEELKAGDVRYISTTSTGVLDFNINIEKEETTIDVESVTVTPKKLSLYVANKTTLKAEVLPENAPNKKVRWQSSNDFVATVNPETGEVLAERAGKATITAISTANGAITDSSEVTVNAYPQNKWIDYSNYGYGGVSNIAGEASWYQFRTRDYNRKTEYNTLTAGHYNGQMARVKITLYKQSGSGLSQVATASGSNSNSVTVRAKLQGNETYKVKVERLDRYSKTPLRFQVELYKR